MNFKISSFSKPLRLTQTTLLLAALALPAAAQQSDTAEIPLEAVEQAYHDGDFAAARAGLLPHAEGGNVTAQYRLGYMMATASGGAYDPDGAKKWLEAAITNEHRGGLVLLARIYLSENPEIPDYERAAELLTMAVKDESAEAHFYLGQLYRNGRGVEGNKETAFALLRKAADAGVGDAQFAIAQMYGRGEGVEQDAAQSSRWLLQAAEAGSTAAMMSLYFNYARGTGFPKDEAKALAYLSAAADGGDTLSERILGSGYLLGDGVPADPEKGVIYLRRAADKGEPGAQSNLGYAYAAGIGVTQDDVLAAEWYKKAADQGLTRAALVLGDFYYTGRGVDKSIPDAVNYYMTAFWGRDQTAAARLGSLVVSGEFPEGAQREQVYVWVAAAAESGDPDALSWLTSRAVTAKEPYAELRLGMIYRDGLGFDADLDKAARHFLKAAVGNMAEAQLQMSEYYASGTGVEQDYAEAHKWANIAAANGNDDAAARRDVLADLMSADQIADAQARAKTFMDAQ